MMLLFFLKKHLLNLLIYCIENLFGSLFAFMKSDQVIDWGRVVNLFYFQEFLDLNKTQDPRVFIYNG